MKKTKNIWGFTSNFLKIIFISLILVGCSAIDNTNNTDNTGTPWDGIIIKTADDLVALSGKDVTENILFDADIDMKGKTFAGIKSFTGAIIDGNGKKILNLKIESDTDNAGLILSVPNGTTTEIKNLTIESGSIKSTSGDAGAFIADSKGTVTLTGLTNKASITGNAVGGIIGIDTGTVTINNANNTGNIRGNNTSGYKRVGGIIGAAIGTVTINNANNTGAISSEDVSGGIIGQALCIVTIKNTANTGTISGEDAGGLIGTTTSASGKFTINTSHSYKTQKLVGTFIVSSLTINNSYYLGSIIVGPGGTPIPADQFKNQASFVGWDFNTIWKMGDLYPELR